MSSPISPTSPRSFRSLKPVRKLALTLAAITAASMALSGCGGGGQTQSGTGSSKPHRGGTLVVGDESQPLSGLDPILAQAFDAKRMAAQFYEGLLSLGPDGSTLKPALAASWKQATPTRYEFTLRSGVTFHDGEAVKASDVAYSLKRIADPKVHSPYAALYRFKDVTAPSADKVVVTLAQPQSSLLHLLAQPWSAGIVSEKWVKSQSANALKTKENGTGPYKLAEFREGSLIKTVRFDGYWDKPKPYIDQIEYRVIPDEATRVQALQSGTVDSIQVSLPKNAASLKKRKFNVGDGYDVGAYWLGLNTLEGPLANDKVRQAISLGIDRKQLISIGAQGAGVVSGVIPAGDPVLSGEKADLPNNQYDPAKAKQLLADSGAGPVKLKLAIRSNRPDKLATAQLIKEQLSKIGVTVGHLPDPLRAAGQQPAVGQVERRHDAADVLAQRRRQSVPEPVVREERKDDEGRRPGALAADVGRHRQGRHRQGPHPDVPGTEPVRGGEDVHDRPVCLTVGVRRLVQQAGGLQDRGIQYAHVLQGRVDRMTERR
ncbi:ABC transporter substrate-binding protein [Streptomyces sp. GLT-R25]